MSVLVQKNLLESQEKERFQLKSEGQKYGHPQAGRVLSYFLFSPSLYLIRWGPYTLGGQCALPSLPVPMLISSRSHPCKHMQNNVWPNLWMPCCLLKWTHKINTQNCIKSINTYHICILYVFLGKRKLKIYLILSDIKFKQVFIGGSIV